MLEMFAKYRVFLSHRGRTASYLTAPAQNPGVRNYRTGLLNGTRFALAVIARLLFSTVRFASVIQSYMPGRCFLCGLRTIAGPFPK